MTLRTRHPESWRFHGASARSPLEMPPPGEVDPLPSKESPGAPIRMLPPPLSLELPLGDAISRRSSYREGAEGALALDRLSTLLVAAYGAERRETEAAEILDRPVPSAGGLYPLELYVLARAIEGLTKGVHHYQPILHGLEDVSASLPAERSLTETFIGQTYVAKANAIIVMTAVFERSLRKYGDRGYRYLLLEAGHVAQNVALAAAALGLGALCVGGFFDHDLAVVLGVDPEIEAPLYALAIAGPAV